MRTMHNIDPDAYHLKRMRDTFSENTQRIRGKLETKAGAYANDSFRCLC